MTRRIPGRVPLLVGVGLEALGLAALLLLAELHVVILLQLLLVGQASCSHGGGAQALCKGEAILHLTARITTISQLTVTDCVTESVTNSEPCDESSLVAPCATHTSPCFRQSQISQYHGTRFFRLVPATLPTRAGAPGLVGPGM